MIKLASLLSRVSALGVPVLTVLFTCHPVASMAQESVDTDDDGVLEEVVIIGSRIRRQDEVSSSPVQTLSAEDLRIDGSLSIGETLQQLPSVGPSLNSNGSAGTSHGSRSLNLRNLDPNRNLILVNGHRWVNGAGTRGFRDFVDLNTIPQAMIEQVEILQDGATAIYGADAISGVVNMHTFQDYEGGRAKAYYGVSSEGDRDTYGIDVLLGKTFGTSNWTLAASYVKEDPIYTQDRKISAIPLNGLATGTPEGLFRENGLAAVVDFPVPSAGITRDPGTDGNDINSWRPVNSATDVFNRYANNYLVGPSERTSVFLQNTTEFGENLTFNLEALYTERKSDQLFNGAAPVVQGSRGFVIANDPRVNPFGITFSGSDFRLTNFFEDNGQRDNQQDVKTMRFGAGLTGEFNNGWAWDTFVSWARNEADFLSVNQIDLDKLALGMLACNSSGIPGDISDLTAGCVPVNLFNPMTPEMVDYVNYIGRDYNKAEQFDFTYNFTGDLFEMPAGTVAFAAGVEYREEKGLDVPDDYINAAPRVNTYRTTTSAPREGTDGKYHLSEAYVEFDVPLVAGKKMVEDLSLQAAVRYSNYSTFGGTTNGKLGMLYRPADSIMFRGTWAQGFRSPSILEMFEGLRETSIPVIDPCNGGGAGLPGCTGVPAGYVQPSSNVPAIVGGNPNLQPETSVNTSFGMVLTPTSLEGASLTVDWYKIDIKDTISAYGAQNVLNLCATTGQRCNYIFRDQSGEILSVVDGPINLNKTNVEGIDIVARYITDAGKGTLDFSLSLSYLIDLQVESTLTNGSVLKEDKVGTSASRESYPEWRGLFVTRYIADKWNAAYTLRYIGSTDEMVSGSPRHISSRVYQNLAGTYQFTDSWGLKLGVDNLFNVQPPSSLTNLNINFDISTYDAVGRFMYAQLIWDFDL